MLSPLFSSYNWDSIPVPLQNAELVLIQSFVCSRIDYCSPYSYIGLPCHLPFWSTCWCYFKSYHVSLYNMPDVLHWFPVSQSIEFRILIWVWRCQLGNASAYAREPCYPHHMYGWRGNSPSTSPGELVVPFPCTSKTTSSLFSDWAHLVESPPCVCILLIIHSFIH